MNHKFGFELDIKWALLAIVVIGLVLPLDILLLIGQVLLTTLVYGLVVLAVLHVSGIIDVSVSWMKKDDDEKETDK